MTVLEKIRKSADETRFILYKEGLFLKCYNQDAMVFVERVKNYKVNSKFVKSVGTEVLSIGFPASNVTNNIISLQSISEAIGSTKYNEETYGFVFWLTNDVKQNYKQLKAENIKVTEPEKLNEPDDPARARLHRVRRN
jgi:hypothetical protein